MTSGVLIEQTFGKCSCLCLCQRHVNRFSPRFFASCGPKKITLKIFRSSCQLLSSTLEELQCREHVGNSETSWWVSLDLVNMVRREPFCNSLFPAHLEKHWGSTLLLEGTDSVPAVWGSLRERNPFSFSFFFILLIMNGDMEIAIKLCVLPRCFAHGKRECCDLEPQHLKSFNIKPSLWVWCV